jgi:hypothetical protein
MKLVFCDGICVDVQDRRRRRVVVAGFCGSRQVIRLHFAHPTLIVKSVCALKVTGRLEMRLDLPDANLNFCGLLVYKPLDEYAGY